MNRHTAAGADDLMQPVDLAVALPFALGGIKVTPSARILEATDWSRRLEPRAMKVLVVLAEASPTVVGRAELNSRVWDGRIVGDDAINRSVQTLRRAASDAPGPTAFSIETVPRVGYRLIAAGPPTNIPSFDNGQNQRTDEIATSSFARSRRLAAVTVAILSIIGASLAWHRFLPAAPALEWRIEASTTLDDLPPKASDIALSPDGRRLAYRGSDNEGHDRILVRAVDGGGIGTPISPSGLDARRPAWSPDGSTLAFASYDAGRPCRLFIRTKDDPARQIGACETARDPKFAWSADGSALILGDASGENAVQRITSIHIVDGGRTVLSSPPADSMGDALPLAYQGNIVFQRRYGWADEGWIIRDASTGHEQLLWRQHGIAGSVAAPLANGSLAIAWTRAGATHLDFVKRDGASNTQPLALGPVIAMSAGAKRLLVETDRSESALVRTAAGAADGTMLLNVRGRISGPSLLPDGRIRLPVASAGVARIWERGVAGSLKPWGSFVAERISGLALSPDGRMTSAMATDSSGRVVVVLDAEGKPVFRWNPHARSLNPPAWTDGGRHLIAPVLDGAGWRLVALDPFGGAPPRETGLTGFAVVLDEGGALYAVRAGESTGLRELWRIDGAPQRLPIDLTLFDIVNWRAASNGIWLPDRSDRDQPYLLMKDERSGKIMRRVPAPGLAGPGSGLVADINGPIYVKTIQDAPAINLLTLAASGAH